VASERIEPLDYSKSNPLIEHRERKSHNETKKMFEVRFPTSRKKGKRE